MNKKAIIKHSLALIVTTIAIKLLGFLKQSVIAWQYGTSIDLDTYYAADGFVSAISLIIAAAIPPAIVTIYVKIKKENERELFINSSLTSLVLIGALITLLVIVASPLLSKTLGLSYEAPYREQLGRFLVYMSPMILFVSITGVASGLMQSKHKFIQDKLLGLCLSVCMILSTLLFGKLIGILALLIGFMAGYLIYTSIMLILLIKNTRIRPCSPHKSRHYKKFIKAVVPLAIGIGVVDISHLIDKIIASSLTEGSVSSLYYSQILCTDLINGIIVSSIGTVLLPKIAKDTESIPKTELIKSLQKVLSVISPIILLISIFYITVGKDIIIILLQRGEFTSDSTNAVFSCVAYYSIGLIFMFIKELLSRYLYAIEKTKIPMKSNIICILINIVLSFALSRRIGVKGIALATTISIMISNIYLILAFKKEFRVARLLHKRTRRDLLKNIVLATATMIIGFAIKQFVLTSNVSPFILSIVCILIMVVFFIAASKKANTELYNEAASTIYKRTKTDYNSIH